MVLRQYSTVLRLFVHVAVRSSLALIWIGYVILLAINMFAYRLLGTLKYLLGTLLQWSYVCVHKQSVTLQQCVCVCVCHIQL